MRINRFRPRRQQDTTRINGMIRVPQIRLIDQEGQALGIRETRDALQMAEDVELDLVEVAPNAAPPVCRIMDYGKFKYEKSKKDKEAKKKQHVVHLKEVKFRPKTGTHDYQYKMEHAREFLLRNDRVKATVMFRGREITHLEFGERILKKLAEDLADIAQVEGHSRREGRTMVAVFVPDKDKVRAYNKQLDQQRKAEAKAEAQAEPQEPEPEKPEADTSKAEPQEASPVDNATMVEELVNAEDSGVPKHKRTKSKKS